MTDYSRLVERLRDLQATTEKSYFYVAKCCRDSISAIEAQRERIERLEGALQLGVDVMRKQGGIGPHNYKERKRKFLLFASAALEEKS